jgi:hypothetical protein
MERGANSDNLLPNVPSDLSLLAFGTAPAREVGSAGAVPKVPKGQVDWLVRIFHFF